MQEKFRNREAGLRSPRAHKGAQGTFWSDAVLRAGGIGRLRLLVRRASPGFHVQHRRKWAWWHMLVSTTLKRQGWEAEG